MFFQPDEVNLPSTLERVKVFFQVKGNSRISNREYLYLPVHHIRELAGAVLKTGIWQTLVPFQFLPWTVCVTVAKLFSFTVSQVSFL